MDLLMQLVQCSPPRPDFLPNLYALTGQTKKKTVETYQRILRPKEIFTEVFQKKSHISHTT